MKLGPVIDYLEANGITEIYEGAFPAPVASGVLLRSSILGTDVLWDTPGYFKTVFQIIVRASKFEDAEAASDDIYHLIKMSNVQLGTMWVNYMRPKRLPVAFPISSANIYEFNLDIEVCFVDEQWA